MSEFLTIKESSAFTGKSESLLYRYIRQGKLKIHTCSEKRGGAKKFKKLKKNELIEVFNMYQEDEKICSKNLNIEKIIEKTLEIHQKKILKPREEEALYKLGITVQENRFLREQIELLKRENRYLKEKLKVPLSSYPISQKKSESPNSPAPHTVTSRQVTLKTNIIELLRKVPLFSGIEEKALHYLSEKIYEKTYEKNAIILQKGEKKGFIGILISGRLKVTMLSLEGREMTLAILKPYGFIGEMSLLDDEPHSATVMALKKSKLLILPKEAFHQILKDNPDTGLFLLKRYVNLVRKLDEQISDLKFMDIHQRTAKRLVDMAGPGKEKTIEITHQELANLVGSTRENVTRSLSEMEKNGFISIKKGKIIIKEIKGLENIYINC